MESTAYILLLCDVCTVYIQLEIGDVIYAAFVLLLPLAGVFYIKYVFRIFKKFINVKIIKMKMLFSEKGKQLFLSIIFVFFVYLQRPA